VSYFLREILIPDLSKSERSALFFTLTVNTDGSNNTLFAKLPHVNYKKYEDRLFAGASISYLKATIAQFRVYG